MQGAACMVQYAGCIYAWCNMPGVAGLYCYTWSICIKELKLGLATALLASIRLAKKKKKKKKKKKNNQVGFLLPLFPCSYPGAHPSTLSYLWAVPSPAPLSAHHPTRPPSVLPNKEQSSLLHQEYPAQGCPLEAFCTGNIQIRPSFPDICIPGKSRDNQMARGQHKNTNRYQGNMVLSKQSYPIPLQQALDILTQPKHKKMALNPIL
jgi:hypothetical protein